jgi:hypothetical protein
MNLFSYCSVPTLVPMNRTTVITKGGLIAIIFIYEVRVAAVTLSENAPGDLISMSLILCAIKLQV